MSRYSLEQFVDKHKQQDKGDGFFELEDRPERVIVVGSGYVAVELAGVFHGLGSDTQVLVRKQRVVRNFDAMLGTELLRAMRDAGITVETAVIPAKLAVQADGIILHAEDGRTFGPADCLLWAVGRAPNAEGLELGNAGAATANDEQIVFIAQSFLLLLQSPR